METEPRKEDKVMIFSRLEEDLRRWRIADANPTVIDNPPSIDQIEADLRAALQWIENEKANPKP